MLSASIQYKPLLILSLYGYNLYSVKILRVGIYLRSTCRNSEDHPSVRTAQERVLFWAWRDSEVNTTTVLSRKYSYHQIALLAVLKELQNILEKVKNIPLAYPRALQKITCFCRINLAVSNGPSFLNIHTIIKINFIIRHVIWIK